jgi:hypothetical protein
VTRSTRLFLEMMLPITTAVAAKINEGDPSMCGREGTNANIDQVLMDLVEEVASKGMRLSRFRFVVLLICEACNPDSNSARSTADGYSQSSQDTRLFDHTSRSREPMAVRSGLHANFE